MGEIKSVKVDNWGVFFLQKLQNFFNKTDYCDLTLQFRDNSQLKVHRLVLSACTDYFNVLEQTCEVIDDALIMPIELQADVVVPIVNFMYTGTLEFELKMYGKLLRTAKEMNMTVLLKLLEAHRRTMEGVNRAQRPPSPKTVRKRGPQTTQHTAAGAQQQQQSQQRRILTATNAPSQQQQQQRRMMQQKTNAPGGQQQPPQFRQQIGSTSLLKTVAGAAAGTLPMKTQYGSTTIYATTTTTTTSPQQQFKHEPEDYETSLSPLKQPSSPFEQLRKGYNNNKRPASSSTFISPPTKKPNIEDVKEFSEQQRMRKQIAAEYGDDQEFEGMLDDDIHADDDDDEATATALAATTTTSTAAATATSSRPQQLQPQRQQQHQSTATITFKQEQNDKPPTIVVKDSSNSNMNHAKIISEVLRQYPHLVKSNKNIKLKIMPNVGGQTQKIIVKKEHLDMDTGSSGGQQQQPPPPPQPVMKLAQTLLKPMERAPIAQPHPLPATKPPAPKVIAAAPVAVVAATASAAAQTATAGAATQKRRIDSKTMHALIALGAENTTGPWLCLRCGVNGRPISIPSYRGFRRHLINTHKEHIDSALCEQCGFRSANQRELHFHAQSEHKVKSALYTYPECLVCADELFIDTNALNQHMLDAHPDENKQQCIYCNKIFAKELQLYTHMKTYHKRQALEDGIIDYSDDEELMGASGNSHEDNEDAAAADKKDTKIKILSDISLPIASSLIKMEHSPKTGAVTGLGAAGGGDLEPTGADDEFLNSSGGVQDSEPKFVNADGNEMLLTDEQRKEIMSQLNQEHDGGGGVVMVLNEPSTAFAEASSMAAESNVSSSATHDAEEEEEHEHEDESQDARTAATHDDEQEEDAEDLGHLEEDEEAAEGDEEEHGMEQDANTTGGDADESFDDSQIYHEFAAQKSGANVSAVRNQTAAATTNKSTTVVATAADTLDEWAENLISAHEMADETATDADKVAEQKAKKDEDISKKLKELTGDWSDDENDEDMEEDETVAVSAASEKEEKEKAAAPEDEEEYRDHELQEQQAEEPSDNKEKPEKDVESAEKTNTADEEAKQTDVADEEEGQQSKVDEDDVDHDVTGKILQKGNISEDNETATVEDAEDGETAKRKQAADDNVAAEEAKPEVEKQAEKMDVDEEEEQQVEKDADMQSEEKESATVAEEIQKKKLGTETKEDAKQVDEGAQAVEEAKEDDATTAAAEEDVSPEDAATRKKLLDELIAEASSAKDDDDQDEGNIETHDADVKVDKLKSAVEAAALTDEEEPKKGAEIQEAAALESAEVKTSSSSTAKAADANEADVEAASDDTDTPSDAIIKDAAVEATEPAAAAAAVTATSSAATAASSSAKTADKVVKSLESEWAADEDDEEDL